jgi:hypothetical protein
MTDSIRNRHSLKTFIKKQFVEKFNHVITNPPEEHLAELHNNENFCFKFNNKSFAAKIIIPCNQEFYYEFYREIGTPHIYGLYNHDKEHDTDTIIGCLIMILRFDNRIWQILDIKIKKEFQGNGYLDALISATLPIRMLKNTGYYTISMNPNPRIDVICSKMKMPKMKSRGKMYIYIVRYEIITLMISFLQTFYSSDIGFIDNNNKRVWYDIANRKELKLLHLHHNSHIRQFDYREPVEGYQYAFAIHESQDFIIKGIKDEYDVDPCATANVFSNDFKPDWSKFVKTFEI